MMKPREKKPSSLLDEERPAIQLSSQQLVTAICVLLVAAAILFLLGWAVGRYEHSYRLQTEGTTDTRVASSADDAAPTSLNGTQRSPRRDLLDDLGDKNSGKSDIVPVPAPPPRSERPAQSFVPSQEPAADSAPPKPAPASSTSPAPTQTKPPAKTPPKAPDEAPAPQESKPTAKQEPAAVQVEPMESVEKPVKENTASTTDKPKSEKEYAVQVVSYGSANSAGAEEYRKKLAKETDLKPELVLSTDGKYLQVIVGRTSDKKTAQETCKELRKQTRFSGCFVRSVE